MKKTFLHIFELLLAAGVVFFVGYLLFLMKYAM